MAGGGGQKGRGVVRREGALHLGPGLCRKAPASQGWTLRGLGDNEHSQPFRRGTQIRKGAQCVLGRLSVGSCVSL